MTAGPLALIQVVILLPASFVLGLLSGRFDDWWKNKYRSCTTGKQRAFYVALRASVGLSIFIIIALLALLTSSFGPWLGT